MPVSTETAQNLIKELYLIGRAIRGALAHPDEGALLPGAIGVLSTLETKGSCRQGDLAVSICISPSALSRHVTDLVAAGYVSRTADPSDGRATLIEVTDAGRALLERIRVSRAEGLQSVLSDWSEEEAEWACTAVRKLRNSLADNAHRSVAGERKPVSNESQGTDV
ncbi:MarR family winged helix-turn-helix transcriptional regulator [Nocardia farcinica]|uniref:MarR family winged helix-turn-helix transcriptional regulator n=1 Tax=Nocardia farcinica TaxID=37329 RepID=UPI001893EF33|nr:MarR family transcriptional regulator [Nocardia farcinica]MBF6270537.1 MarR family transcriptional regulator [Nocardia farcinica]MCZ9325722.1 MarR family transcriptional regulator [Nocardia farcinica]